MVSYIKRTVGWGRLIIHHAPSLPQLWKQQLLNILFWALPDDELSAVFRAAVLRLVKIKVGEGAMVRQGVRITGHKLSLGVLSSVGACSHLDCRDDQIIISNHAILSPRVTIVTANHELNGELGRLGKIKPAPVFIDEGAWLCCGCIILPGVTVGARSVVAAGAVVTHDVPENTMVAGVPAKVVKHLD